MLEQINSVKEVGVLPPAIYQQDPPLPRPWHQHQGSAQAGDASPGCDACMTPGMWRPLSESHTGSLSASGLSLKFAESRVQDRNCDEAPAYLSDICSQGMRVGRTLRSSSEISGLKVGPFNNRYGGRSFSVCAPGPWNTLPCNIRELVTCTSFKAAVNPPLLRPLQPDLVWNISTTFIFFCVCFK